ncbi:MAG: glycosyltransferase family 4 protein [Chloroflexi bacterium]|nr:glycosyltransferase family 4 protein [Chloroflexota bacterium]
MKIGYLMQEGVPDLDVVSGAQLHVQAVITGLQKRGHAVRTFLPRAKKPVWSDDLNQPEWQPTRYTYSAHLLFRLIERPLRRVQSELHLPYFNLFESLRFSDAAEQGLAHCDLIFERFGFMGFAGALTARRLNIPHILEVNGDVPKEIEVLGVKMSAVQRAASLQVVRRTFAAATGIVCVAPMLKQNLVTEMRIDPNKIEVILNGADTELFAAPKDQISIREKFGIAPRPTITFVGTFQPWHGINLLLDSFAHVQKKIPDVQLLLVGAGGGRGEAEQRVERAGWGNAVRFLGRLENRAVADILAITDVAVIPFPYLKSDIVGSPLKIFEYMAAGCPIVASWSPIHDVIEHAVTGMRVPPADADALAEMLACVLSDADLRARLGACARQVALECYSWDNTIQQLENFFDRVLTKQHKGRTA